MHGLKMKEEKPQTEVAQASSQLPMRRTPDPGRKPGQEVTPPAGSR